MNKFDIEVTSVRIFSFILPIGLFLACTGVACIAQENASEDKAASEAQTSELAADTQASTAKFAPLGAPKKPEAKFAPLGAAKKPEVAKLGKPAKPKFALKRMGGGGAGAAAPDRAAEVKRLIDAYHNIAIYYADRIVLATTPEEIAEAEKRKPSARALRPIARLIAEIVAVDPKDEPALDALLFLSKFVGVEIIDETLAKAVSADGTEGIDTNALILEHHADNEKVAALLRKWPMSEETDQFLLALFEKTHHPKVRAASGIRLIGSLQKNNQEEHAEQLAELMSEDRYLDGVPITSRPNGPTARDWAEGKLREIRLLGIGKVLPDVYGATLEGDTVHIADYRGKVVVLDVWTTWCGPCVAMIPHQLEMTERFQDEPFALLSVSCDAELETLEQFLETKEMPWDHWWVGMDGEFSKTLNIRSFPSLFVLDAKGVIRHKNIKDEELEDAVKALLEEAKESGEES